MARGHSDQKMKAEVIRLRVEERLSIREICSRTGVPKGTASMWLQPYPRTEEEKKGRSPYPRTKKSRGEEAWTFGLARQNGFDEWSTMEKGRVSEAAVLFRLVLNGWSVLSPVFDGDRTDWLVDARTRLLRFQVKTAKAGTHGLPLVQLVCSDGRKGRRRYRSEEVDVVVGYDLVTDTCYVWAHDEFYGRTNITVHPEAAEAWDKVHKMCAPVAQLEEHHVDIVKVAGSGPVRRTT